MSSSSLLPQGWSGSGICREDGRSYMVGAWLRRIPEWHEALLSVGCKAWRCVGRVARKGHFRFLWFHPIELLYALVQGVLHINVSIPAGKFFD